MQVDVRHIHLCFRELIILLLTYILDKNGYMIIIHYFLGFPPMRSGGLTRYAIDLMKEQHALGHSVIAIYPKMNLQKQKNSIVFTYKGTNANITMYEMKGALPVPLLYGVNNPDDYMPNYEESKPTIANFFESVRPDIFHIHTLMGLPIEVLEVAKMMGIRTVFTSHDYFGLCPKVNFIDYTGQLCEGMEERHCTACNKNAWSRGLLWLRNSRLMVILKRLRR